MEIYDTIERLQKALHGERLNGRTVGFVPTMGALHAGHLSLVARARAECDVVVLSIFVNPLQFAVNEDLSRYPRPFEIDCSLAEAARVDMIFAPAADEMYNGGDALTNVHVAELSAVLEGARRPGHFDGVATVVSKLFNIVGPCRAYFGEKDWQQLIIVSRMVRDLNIPVTVVPCPIVREADGLALSSRNVYLDASERMSAILLSRALGRGLTAIAAGARNPIEVSAFMMQVMERDAIVEPQYAAVVGPDMSWPEKISGTVRLLVAAVVGTTRLIDNTGATINSDGSYAEPRTAL